MDDKDLPVPINHEEQVEISDGKRKLLKTLGERLSRADAVKYEERLSYSSGLSENAFVMIDTSDATISISSNRWVDRDGKDTGRSIKLGWIQPDTSEVGGVYYEDKRLEGNHHRPFEGGIFKGINDAELKAWKDRGGFNCGLWFASRDDHTRAYLSYGGIAEGVQEITDDKIEILIDQVRSGHINTERMRIAANCVVDSAKPSGVSEAHSEITFLTPTP